ncbi:MAG: hypothetical protein J6Y22_09165, partial [Paludibacteraceae bacterium]|nr:hypothetical protein [Paludibacteraceae bacterium]
MGKRLYTWLLLSLGVVTGAFAQSKTISGGNDHGLIICAEGYLYTWGNNYSSIMAGPLLGIDPSESGYDDKIVYSPKRVKTGNLTFSQVTSGSGAFNLALSCHKVVYAWGDNQNDGCGQGGQGGNVVSFPTPVLKGETPGYNEDGSTGGPYLGGVTYIAASTNSGFAIMNDGRVVGWGKGEWNSATGNNAGLPRYIKDKAGNDIKNVTHISGGDDNCLIRTEDGSLYGIGPWNGNSNATSTVAVPVLKADDNTPLTDIRMSAAGDVCGFAVTGDGYVWSWGNGGWGGSTGQQRQGLTHYNAMKVASGEYKTISGEEYLTDIKEVIGGRGHGAAVSKEGYLVYWGCDEDNGGVAPTNDATKTKYPNGAQGVLPILARYCDASGKPGELVKDAVSISRGDNFDFMVNDKDEFYVWGLNDLGQCGVGSATVSKYTCLTKLTTIPCEIQDGCPEVYMINRMKCPGEEIELDCGFTVPKGKEERYFVTWMYEGKVLNSSTTTDPESVRAADPYNVTSIKVTKTGEYTVTIEYIGGNIPCDKCKIAKTSCTVKEMEMPIDTIVTTMNCVADPLKPAASDNICFKAVVNNSFYKATQKTTFAAFSTKDSKDTLAVVETTGAGGKIEFCVSGDKIDKTQVHDNKNEAEPDTTYTVWLEDVSTFDTYLNKNAKLTTAGSFQSYGLLIDIYSDAILKSFTFSAKSHSGETTISVTPVLYEAVKNTNDLYVVGNRVQSGKAQSFTIDDSGPQDVVVNCDFVIEGNPTRGVRYILGMNIGTSNFQLYTGSVAAVKENSAEFTTPIIDSEKMGIYAMGGTANSYNAQSNGSSVTCYKDVLFGKMTDYNCGRMMLTAQYGCPPCTSPDEVKMQVDGAARTADTIFLCEESPAVELSVENVKSSKEPSAAFDVLWFVDKLGTETDAAQVDMKVSSSTYKTKIKWSASKEGTTEKYYVRGRDNEKPTSSDCFAHDSVVVKYNKKPVVPTIEIPSFCKGLVDADVTKYLDNDLKSLLLGLDADIKDPSNASVTVADLASSLETLAAGTQTYKITVTDIQTGCVSDESSFDVEVKAIPDKPTIDNLDFVVSDVTDQTVKAGATATAGADLHWYSKKSDYPANPSTAVPTISLKDEATFTFWVSQNLDGCESDTASFLVTVNDAPVPAARDTAICVQNSLTNPTPSVDLSTLVEAGDPREPSTAFTLNWYTDPNAAKKTGSATPPTVDYSKVGLQTFYVSQTNSVTGAESNKKAVSVMVYAAHQLSPISPDTYCDEEQNPRALVKYAEDGTTDYEKASDIQWYLYGDAWDKDKLPVLGIEKDTTYIFGAVQSYTITSATGKELETCYSDTTFYTVNVLYTPPTGDSSVAYIAAEVGSDNKTFPAITTKEGWSEEPGYTYYYSEAGKNNFSTSVPKPVYDVSNLNGSTTTILYDVYRVKDGTSKECPSEVKTISVSISDAMPPKVKDYHYCEGSSLQPITAEIRPISGKTENDYELYWYTSKPSSTTTTPDATGSTYSLSGAAAVESDGTIKSTTYYVAQHDVGTGATSAAVEVHVVVYPKPILDIDDPDATCGSDNKFVDITGTWKASNTSE